MPLLNNLPSKETILKEFGKGFLLGLIYLETTKANDTTVRNLLMFTSFYIIMALSAHILKVDPQIVVNGFLTKTIFTLIDERIKIY